MGLGTARVGHLSCTEEEQTVSNTVSSTQSGKYIELEYTQVRRNDGNYLYGGMEENNTSPIKSRL